jgi:hypothetical protein
MTDIYNNLPQHAVDNSIGPEFQTIRSIWQKPDANKETFLGRLLSAGARNMVPMVYQWYK